MTAPARPEGPTPGVETPTHGLEDSIQRTTTDAPALARTLRLADVTDDEARRWAELSDRALVPNPFLDPAYLRTAVATMDKAADVVLVVVERGGRWEALLPLGAGQALPGRRAPMPQAVLAGAFHEYVPLGAPLLDPGRPREAWTAVLKHLASRRSGVPGIVELSLLPTDGGLYDLVVGVARELGMPMLERWRFARGSVRYGIGRETWRDGLNGPHRKELRRLTRRFGEAGGAEPVLADLTHEPDAVARLFALEAAGWKGDRSRGGWAARTSAHKNAWYEAMARAFAARGRLRITGLSLHGEDVYLQLSFTGGGHEHGFIDAYDERYAALSLGTLGRALIADRWERTPGVTLFDSVMHPKFATSTAYFPDRRELVGVVLATRGLGNRALVRAVPAVAAARRAVRRRVSALRRAVTRRRQESAG